MAVNDVLRKDPLKDPLEGFEGSFRLKDALARPLRLLKNNIGVFPRGLSFYVKSSMVHSVYWL